MDAQAVGRLVDHLVARVDAAPASPAPFYHLEFTEVFPDDVYAAMLAAIPEAADYRALRGRGDANMRRTARRRASRSTSSPNISAPWSPRAARSGKASAGHCARQSFATRSGGG
jgi:hypothetical protein